MQQKTFKKLNFSATQMFKYSLALLASMLFIFVMLVLQMGVTSTPKSKPILQTINTQVPPSFKDITFAAGINHSHLQNTGQVTDLIDTTQSGACVADFDNDGWQDLLFMAGGGQTRFYGKSAWWQGHSPVVLYQNKLGTFLKQAPPKLSSQGSTTACTTADFNQDGLIDFIAATTEQDHLFINKGGFIFEEDPDFTQTAGLSWTSHVSAVDINNDGLIDLHLSKYLKYRQNLKNLELASGFTEQHHLQMDPGKFDGIENKVLINKGFGKFAEMTEKLGLNGNPERTLSSLWADINQDGLVDLIEHNVGDQAVRSYLQNQLGRFEEIIEPNWGLRANNVNYSIVGKQIYDSQVSWFATRPSGLSSLYKSLDNLTLDSSWKDGLVTHERAYQTQWGSVMADLNNDGYADIVIASGGKEPDVFSPKMTIPMPDLCAIRQLSESRLTKTAFSVDACSGQRVMSSRSVLELDYNNDGLIDLLFLSNNDFPQLLKNVSAHKANWIGFSIPAMHKIELVIGDHNQTFSAYQNQALYGSHDPRVHVGLGSEIEVRVRLLSEAGKIIDEHDLAANSYYRYNDRQWHADSAERHQQDLPIHDNRSRIIHDSNHLDAYMLHGLGRLKSLSWFDNAEALLNNQNTRQLSRLITVIKRYQEMDTLPFYLELIDHSNAKLADVAAQALTRLESEYSTSILLAKIETNDAKKFCRIAAIFATWFDEEEAVNRSKGRAIPFFIRGLQHANHDIVNCSASALATAEHINGAFAIIDIIDVAPHFEQTIMVNALGKIRQKAATDKLVNIFKQNPYASIKQQALIALTRLDYKFIDELIATSDNNPILWLSIFTISDALDGVVIPKVIQDNWLLGMPIANLEDFILPENRGLYLQTLANGRLQASSERLNSFNETDRIHVGLANALLKLAPLPDEALSFLLTLELNPKQLIEVAKKLHQHNLAAINNEGAITNLFAISAYLNVTQKLALLDGIHYQSNIVVSDDIVKTFLNACIEETDNLSLQEKEKLPSALVNLLMACNIYEDLNKGKKIEDRLLLISATYPPNQLKKVIDLVKTNTSQLSKTQMYKLSSAVLYRSKLDMQIKSDWASWHMKTDNLSRTWLRKHLEIGNEALLTTLLDENLLGLLEQGELFDSLLKNTQLSDEVKYRLEGFMHSIEFTKGRQQ